MPSADRATSAIASPRHEHTDAQILSLAGARVSRVNFSQLSGVISFKAARAARGGVAKPCARPSGILRAAKPLCLYPHSGLLPNSLLISRHQTNKRTAPHSGSHTPSIAPPPQFPAREKRPPHASHPLAFARVIDRSIFSFVTLVRAHTRTRTRELVSAVSTGPSLARPRFASVSFS